MPDTRLKCKFCDWTTAKAYTKGGKFHGVEKAQQRLLEHVFLEHPDEHEKVLAQIEDESGNLLPTYTLSADGKSITCLACGKTSHSAQDVKNKYCGYCHKYHERP